MYAAIKYLYPNARPEIDFLLRDDGDGQYIEHWNEAALGPRPSAEQLAAVEEAAELAAAVPRSVTMRQARLALLQAGLLGGVAAAINALPSPQKEAAQIEWEYSQEVQRDKALVQTLGPALGLTSAQLDDLFIAAAEL